MKSGGSHRLLYPALKRLPIMHCPNAGDRSISSGKSITCKYCCINDSRLCIAPMREIVQFPAASLLLVSIVVSMLPLEVDRLVLVTTSSSSTLPSTSKPQPKFSIDNGMDRPTSKLSLMVNNQVHHDITYPTAWISMPVLLHMVSSEGTS